MKNKVNAPEIPLCTNILRLQSYLLSPDEVMLFDWLIVKQISFKYKDFHYSQSRIEEETRIKRTRQEAIIKQFCALGFLKPEVKMNKVTRGKVRYFRVDFKTLSDKKILCQVIDEEKTLFKDYLRFIAYHATIQSQGIEKKKDETSPTQDTDRIYQLLNETYEERRTRYNEGRTTDEIPEMAIPPMQLPRNKAINKKLLHLSNVYNDDTIHGAFTAYADAIFESLESPKKPLDYFLSYNDTKDSFGVVEFYINAFTMNYSTPNNDYDDLDFYYDVY